MARESSRVFRIFVSNLFLFIEEWKTHGCVVKCGRGSFMPVLAHSGRFGGISRKSGPTDHPAAKRPVKRKFGKNNRSAGQWSFGIPERPKTFS